MKWFKVLAVLTLVALAVGVAPSVARADEPDYSNPIIMRGLLEKLSPDNPDASKVFAHLSPKARAALLEVAKRSRMM